MYHLKIKPLSLNCAYRGRRFETQLLRDFKKEVFYLAPKIKIPDCKLEVHYRFGVSSKNCDADNNVKAFQDAISTKYGFNDKQIYKISVEKIDVCKGEEFIDFEIRTIS